MDVLATWIEFATLKYNSPTYEPLRYSDHQLYIGVYKQLYNSHFALITHAHLILNIGILTKSYLLDLRSICHNY